MRNPIQMAVEALNHRRHHLAAAIVASWGEILAAWATGYAVYSVTDPVGTFMHYLRWASFVTLAVLAILRIIDREADFRAPE